jgi:hypothetical protein
MKEEVNGFLFFFNRFDPGYALPLPANSGSTCSEHIPVASWDWQTLTGK